MYRSSCCEVDDAYMVHNIGSQRAQLIDWSRPSLETVFFFWGKKIFQSLVTFILNHGMTFKTRFPLTFVQTLVPQNGGWLGLEPPVPSQNEHKLTVYILKQPHSGMTHSKLRGLNDRAFWYIHMFTFTIL